MKNKNYFHMDDIKKACNLEMMVADLCFCMQLLENGVIYLQLGNSFKIERVIDTAQKCCYYYYVNITAELSLAKWKVLAVDHQTHLSVGNIFTKHWKKNYMCYYLEGIQKEWIMLLIELELLVQIETLSRFQSYLERLR